MQVVMDLFNAVSEERKGSSESPSFSRAVTHAMFTSMTQLDRAMELLVSHCFLQGPPSSPCYLRVNH